MQELTNHPIVDEPELLFQVALTFIPQVGAITARNLLSYCGSAEAVFRASHRSLLKIPGIGPKTATNIKQPAVLEEAEKELQFLRAKGIRPIFFTHPDYPRRLRHYSDAPILLYLRGQVDLNAGRVVAMVGTRTPTAYGRIGVDQIIEGLKPYSPLVVSGLAYGIDIQAHRACLQHQIPTVAVLGSGHRHLYPAAHTSVARDMLSDGGLLTEFPSPTKPDRENFPMRNRIIAGMADAIVVVETATRGGSIITAELANGYHKDVFAMPGPVNAPFSQGCNRLIKIHKASLIESAADIAYIMGWEKEDQKAGRQQELAFDLSSEEKRVHELLVAENSVGVDLMTHRLSLSAGELSGILLQLEVKGLIRSIPGNRYMICR